MSALFKAEVTAVDVERSIATIQLTIINPDQKSFYNTKSFGFMLLIDPFYQTTENDAPILKKIPLAEIKNFNLALFKKKANEIVKKTEIINTINFPFPAELANMSTEERIRFFSNDANLPQADVLITVKDPNDIKHLNIGQQWESGAYNIL